MTEKISALVDEHGSPKQRREALANLAGNARAHKTWERYHLIGGVMRGEVAQTGGDLSAQIDTRLDMGMDMDGVAGGKQKRGLGTAKPWWGLADGMRPELASKLSLKLAWKSLRNLSWKLSSKPAAPIAWGAVAAVLLAVILFNPLYRPFGNPVGNNRPIAQQAQHAERDNAQLAQEVNALLVKHGEFTSTPGMNGLGAYVKLVSGDAIE